jgi:hypothetical protein
VDPARKSGRLHQRLGRQHRLKPCRELLVQRRGPIDPGGCGGSSRKRMGDRLLWL